MVKYISELFGENHQEKNSEAWLETATPPTVFTRLKRRRLKKLFWGFFLFQIQGVLC